MKKFNDIYKFLKERKKILNKLHKAQNEVKKLESQIKEIEKPFHECSINIDEYREFFSKYYIDLGNNSKYFVKRIELTKDYEGNPFYDVIYDFEENNQKTNGSLSLRKFLHLLDYQNTQLKKI